MRVLLLSQWYPPEPDCRLHHVAEFLVSCGCEVTVITGFPNYPGGRVYPGYKIRWRQWEHLDGVRVLRLPIFPSHDRSVLRRFLTYASFSASAATLGTALCGKADVMWVLHPPLTVGLPALVLSAFRRIPFIFEIQDMWPESLASTGMVSSKSAIKIVGIVANWIYRAAKRIVVISEGFKQNLVTKGVSQEKIEVVANWADETIFRPLERDAAFAAECGMDGKFNVVFGGNLGAAQAMYAVLDAAHLLLDQPEVQFVLIGDGIELGALQAYAKTKNLANVRFLGRQAIERMPHYFAQAEVLLVHLKRDPLFSITIPSKLSAYLACGRPVLCAADGEAASVVQDAGAGLACPPEDPVALANAIRQLHAMPRDARDAMGKAGRAAYETRLSQRASRKRYLELFRDVSGCAFRSREEQ